MKHNSIVGIRVQNRPSRVVLTSVLPGRKRTKLTRRHPGHFRPTRLIANHVQADLLQNRRRRRAKVNRSPAGCLHNLPVERGRWPLPGKASRSNSSGEDDFVPSPHQSDVVDGGLRSIAGVAGEGRQWHQDGVRGVRPGGQVVVSDEEDRVGELPG